MKTTGRVNGIISNIVIVKADGPVGQNEICHVYCGDTKMMAEVIKVVGDNAYVQVFDSTRGLKIGEKVEFEGHMLEATLAPGLLSRNYDGLQNDLEKMDGLFIARGSITDPIDFEKKWEFKPLAKPGDKVSAASWLGQVKEEWVEHKIMVPFTMEGTYTVKSVVPAGEYKVTDTIAVITDADGRGHDITMVQRWPVKQAVRCYREKPRPSRVMETGVRAIDTFNPLAEGGTGFIPGPFGAGKTVLQHAISKQADADVIIIVACGERANEVVEIFKEFPELVDPRTGHKLMERTIIICNTSNMPVAAREASVYRLEKGGLGTGRPLCAPAVTDPLKAPCPALPPFPALADPADSIGLLQLLLKHGVLRSLERAQALFKQPHVVQRIAEKRDHKRTRLNFLWRGI